MKSINQNETMKMFIVYGYRSKASSFMQNWFEAQTDFYCFAKYFPLHVSMWIVLVYGGKCYRKRVKDEQITRQLLQRKSYRNGSEEVETKQNENKNKHNCE